MFSYFLPFQFEIKHCAILLPWKLFLSNESRSFCTRLFLFRFINPNRNTAQKEYALRLQGQTLVWCKKAVSGCLDTFTIIITGQPGMGWEKQEGTWLVTDKFVCSQEMYFSWLTSWKSMARMLSGLVFGHIQCASFRAYDKTSLIWWADEVSSYIYQMPLPQVWVDFLWTWKWTGRCA